MPTKEDNQLVTRIGPGTPMGDAMRRYWMPAALSEELPAPDCPPVRVRLLGEDLVAFRDTNGRVGLLAANCPHRGASLFFGRNEEAGLRCVYHGWKFDVTGQCVDMPNEPTESNFKDKIHHRAYPCEEAGGIVWAYMGPPERMPPLVDLEWMRLPEGHRWVSKTFEDCNYLQAIEGGVDTSHSSFLHRRMASTGQVTLDYRAVSTAPRLEVLETDYGYTYAGLRDLPGEGKTYVRVYHFVMPFYQLRAFEGRGSGATINGHIWVPIDDEQTFIYNWICAADGSPIDEPEIIRAETEFGRGPDDMLPGYRLRKNKGNDYMIDREEQQQGRSYTGITGVNTQDMAVQESMGPIYDRTQEHLGAADLAVIATRRLLIQAARDVEAGLDPVGVRGSGNRARPAEMVLPAGISWQEAMREATVARW